LEWVIRQLGWAYGRGFQSVEETGVNRAPEWKDDFDNARQERKLEAVACTPKYFQADFAA